MSGSPPFPLLLLPLPSPLTCHWGKEGKHLLSCTSLLSPWVRSVGSSSWLCTVRRFCRICLSSCCRSIAGIPGLLIFPPYLPEVMSRSSMVLSSAWGLLWREALLLSCLTPKLLQQLHPLAAELGEGLAALGPALGSWGWAPALTLGCVVCFGRAESCCQGLHWGTEESVPGSRQPVFICFLLIHPAPAQSP